MDSWPTDPYSGESRDHIREANAMLDRYDGTQDLERSIIGLPEARASFREWFANDVLRPSLAAVHTWYSTDYDLLESLENTLRVADEQMLKVKNEIQQRENLQLMRNGFGSLDELTSQIESSTTEIATKQETHTTLNNRLAEAMELLKPIAPLSMWLRVSQRLLLASMWSTAVSPFPYSLWLSTPTWY